MLEVVTSEGEELPRTGLLANHETLARHAATVTSVLAVGVVLGYGVWSRFSGGSSTEQTSDYPE